MSDQAENEVKEKIVYVERPAKKGQGLWWKIPLGLIILIVVASAVSSGKKDEPKLASDNQSQTSTSTTPEPKKDFKTGDLVDFQGKQFKVTNVKRNATSSNSFSKPKTGNEYVVVSVEITNNSDKELPYNAFYFKLQDSTGDQKSTAFAVGVTDNDLSSGTLAQKGVKKADLVFEVPKRDEGLKLIYDDSFWSKDRIEVIL